MIYIGIDPGLSGAVGVIGEYGTTEVYDTPTLEVDGKRKYNIPEMVKILKAVTEDSFAHHLVVLEAVHSMPKQGVASSFSFGEGLGIWKGILGALGLSVEHVAPQRWKKLIMADMGKEKDAARLKAMQLFPDSAEKLSRKKDDGRAEALLMAEYGRRIRVGS